MQGKIQVRGLNPKQLQKWRVAFTTDDPCKLDSEADRYRKHYGKVNAQVSAILTRSEKTLLTRSVLERDKRKCRKCGNMIDVQVVSLRYEEYHNPSKLVTLCRVCRHARKILLDEPFDVKAVRRWLCNGSTGIEELVEDFREKYPDRYAEVEKQAGAEGAVELVEKMILRTSFGGNPFLNRSQSPQMGKALEEQTERDPIPVAFLMTDEDSK